MKPLTAEIRKLIVEAKQRNEKESDIAKWLNISESSVTVIWRLFRKSNSIEPKPYPGAKPVFTDEMKMKVKQLIKENPDMTLEEIIDNLSLPIKKSRLSRWLIESGYPYKKKRYLRPSNLEKMFKKKEKSGKKHKTH
jgi:transposase